MRKSWLKILVLKLARMKYVNRWLMLASDIFLAVFASVVAYFSLCLLLTYNISRANTLSVILYSFFGSLLVFFVFRTYKGIARHSSFSEIWKLIGASFFKVVLGLLLFLYFPVFKNQLVVPFYLMADFFITLFLLIFTRVIVVSVYRYTVNMFYKRATPIFIYGVSSKCVEFAHGIDAMVKSKYTVQGFVSDDPKMENQTIAGVDVFYASSEEDFEALFEDGVCKHLLFVSEETARSVKNTVISYCKNNNVTVLLASSIGLMNETNLQNQIREIQIEDLLNRSEIHINIEKISALIEGKVVMVTGAAGSIGSELCRQLAVLPIKKLVFLDSAETPMFQLGLELKEKYSSLDYYSVIGDVRSKERLNQVFSDHRPQIVFHAAAYKHVPLMEANPCEALRVNTTGTVYLADISVKYGVERFILISTDKAVNPTNVMGATKRLAEIYVQSLDAAIKKGLIEGKTHFITTRFGNVLGSNGSVVPFFREQIKKGGPITVTHPDITRFFMTISEACRLVLEAFALGAGSEIFVFEMGESVKIVDLARKMIELVGLKEGEDISIVFSGLRPGEKLYEEVLSDLEHTLPTSNAKIRIAKVREYDYSEINEKLRLLSDLAKGIRVNDAVKMMKEIIPEYKSQNSKFQSLDKK